MNWLQWSLRVLKQVFPTGPYRDAPWRLVKCKLSLVKCQCSVRFLTNCRQRRVIPNFVRNCSKAKLLFGACVSECEENFQRKVLNMVIRGKFRSIRYKKGLVQQAVKNVHDKMAVSDAKWSVAHSHWMSKFVAREETARLRHKLKQLVQRQDKPSDVTVEEEASRRVVIEDSIAGSVPETVKTLMGLGPKFVPRTRITTGVLRRAELGVERLAFGRRWQREAERKRRADDERERNDQNEKLSEDRPVRLLDEDLRLKKIATTKKQGPLMEAKEENGLRRLKENIVKLYKKDPPGKHLRGRQLTKKEREDIEQLRADDNIVVKPSDKSKGFVIMSKASYVEKVNTMLANPASYERCQITLEELVKRTRSMVTKNIEGKVPASLANELVPQSARMSQFYGLPKDHKPGMPLRPVVSTCGSPSSNVSLLLERILNQLLKFVPAHLANTQECVRELCSLGHVPNDCIVASLDVVSLYSNIPIDESIDAAIELLDQHRREVDMFYLTLSDVRQALMFVLESNYFAFGDAVYRQKKGLAMGNNLAPPMAIIFMSKLETEALALSPQKPSLYRRYIDDCIVVWLHGMEQLLEFVEFMNSRHPDIKFTIDHTEQNAEHNVSNLDLLISVENGNINWELFMKPSHSGVHLSFNSALPGEVKSSVAVEQFRRARRNASTEQGIQRGIEKIERLLRENDFPPDVIQTAKERATLRQKEQQRNKTSDSRSSIIKLPFVDDHHARSVRQAVRSFSKDVRVVFCAGRSLKDMLVSSSFGCRECPKERYEKKRTRGRPPECRACDAGIRGGECMMKNVIYSMFCSECNAEYIGETARCLRERYQEHYRQARALTVGTPWGEHYALHHGRRVPQVMPFGNASILTSETSHINRRIMEAMFIRDRQPAVNSDCGWKLLDTV